MDSYEIGFLTGFLFVVIVIFITGKTTRDKAKRQYDERQKAARGRAYGYSYFVLLTYVIMDFCLKVDGVPIFEQFMEPSLALFIGIILSVIVNVVYCIWNDAYYGMQESTKKITIMFTVVFALNVLSTIVYRENLVKDGKMTFHMANPICAGLVALVVLVTFLKKKRDEHEMEDENG